MNWFDVICYSHLSYILFRQNLHLFHFVCVCILLYVFRYLGKLIWIGWNKLFSIEFRQTIKHLSFNNINMNRNGEIYIHIRKQEDMTLIRRSSFIRGGFLFYFILFIARRSNRGQTETILEWDSAWDYEWEIFEVLIKPTIDNMRFDHFLYGFVYIH